jgi:hypothetical protein
LAFSIKTIEPHAAAVVVAKRLFISSLLLKLTPDARPQTGREIERDRKRESKTKPFNKTAEWTIVGSESQNMKNDNCC